MEIKRKLKGVSRLVSSWEYFLQTLFVVWVKEMYDISEIDPVSILR
jgi:hypothetical protein